jgi:hypothetical protein
LYYLILRCFLLSLIVIISGCASTNLKNQTQQSQNKPISKVKQAPIVQDDLTISDEIISTNITPLLLSIPSLENSTTTKIDGVEQAKSKPNNKSRKDQSGVDPFPVLILSYDTRNSLGLDVGMIFRKKSSDGSTGIIGISSYANLGLNASKLALGVGVGLEQFLGHVSLAPYVQNRYECNDLEYGVEAQLVVFMLAIKTSYLTESCGDLGYHFSFGLGL